MPSGTPFRAGAQPSPAAATAAVIPDARPGRFAVRQHAVANGDNSASNRCPAPRRMRSGDQPVSSAAHGGLAPAREQVIAETLEANVSAAIRPSTVRVSSRPPR